MLFEPVKGKMCVCVCVLLDILYSAEKDVQFTCKVRTLVGGEDSFLCSSQLQTSGQDLRLGFSGSSRLSHQGTEKPRPHHAGSSGQIQQNNVFTKDIGILVLIPLFQNTTI